MKVYDEGKLAQKNCGGGGDGGEGVTMCGNVTFVVAVMPPYSPDVFAGKFEHNMFTPFHGGQLPSHFIDREATGPHLHRTREVNTVPIHRVKARGLAMVEYIKQ